MEAIDLKPRRRLVLGLACAALATLPFAQSTNAASAPSALTLASVFSGRFTGYGTETDLEHSRPRTVTLSGRGTRIRGGVRFAYNVAFSDGERQHKVWTFLQTGPNAYVGRRSDLVGEAKVTQTGDDVSLTYTAVVPTKNGPRDVNFSESFTQVGPKTIINRLSATYLFFNVASSQITLRKLGK